ncbi:MAG TPA: nucleotide exchange factor GrpE [Limnochordales bacterium]
MQHDKDVPTVEPGARATAAEPDGSEAGIAAPAAGQGAAPDRETAVPSPEAGEEAASAAAGGSEGEAAPGDAPPAEEDLAAEAARLRERVAALEARERELADQYVRLLAEFDNYRRRTRQEMETLRKTAAERLLADVLPVLDSLEHAIAAAGEAVETPLGQGVRLIRQQLGDVLARHGLMPIEAVGQPFDPNTMEAVAEAEPGEGAPAGHVVEEYRRGYRLHDKVLRPSLVKVAAAR